MWKLETRKIIKIAEFLKKLPKSVADHAFFVSLILIAIAAILGIVLYKYSFLTERKEPEIEEQPMILDEKVIQEVLEIRQERQKRLDQAQFKEYPNPFSVD